MNGTSRRKVQRIVTAAREKAAHRRRHGERHFLTRGDAYEAGYRVGYAKAYQFWYRQLKGKITK